MPAMNDWLRDDLLGKENDLCTALTSANPAPAVLKLCAPDAALMFPNMDIISPEDQEAFHDAMQPPFHRFDDYQVEDMRAHFIGLMGGVVTYKIKASRGKEKYRATASSTWNQGADGEWLLVAHSETPL
ncbi:uncharacterized protein TRIREDRAFT_70894 [Trichoderma reesei QM6a]|uniref:Predicted protein n=2 Tax=Hypocrea jecorina TaxID=51453 RepID=G0RXA4_HYPJQ|nr:uncharacterized protein TRIREDRAFT_70894 [Trichoderma reesei QM6a]EGR44183.1 predicted protein [Trichoderma reesei QM6a]ETR96820.1 hypothetical protein M419DRAFT_13263 [Trichoderma reesei RUT C-30]